MFKFIITVALILLVSADAAKSGCTDVKPDFCALKNNNADSFIRLFPTEGKDSAFSFENIEFFTVQDKVAVLCVARGPVGFVKFTYSGKTVTDRESPYSMKENPTSKGDVVVRHHVSYLTSNGGGIKKFSMEAFAEDGSSCFKDDYKVEMKQRQILPVSCGSFVHCGVSTDIDTNDFTKLNDKSVTNIPFQPFDFRCFTKGGVGLIKYKFMAGGKVFDQTFKRMYKNDGDWSIAFPGEISDPAGPSYCGPVKIALTASNRGKKCFGKVLELNIKCKNGQKPGKIPN